MTTVTFHKSKSGEYESFICSGHAGFADYGKDIVCASISVLVINTINSLEEIVHEKIKVDTDEKHGRIICRFKGPLQDSSKVLIDSLILGLSRIAQQYGKEYCKLEFKEM